MHRSCSWQKSSALPSALCAVLKVWAEKFAWACNPTRYVWNHAYTTWTLWRSCKFNFTLLLLERFRSTWPCVKRRTWFVATWYVKFWLRERRQFLFSSPPPPSPSTLYKNWKRNRKNSFEERKILNILGDLWEKLMSTISTTYARMAVWKLLTWSRQILDDWMFARGDAPKLVPTRTHYVYRFIVPFRWANV